MASAVTTPLERQFGQMPSLTQMTSVSSFAHVADHAAVLARSQHRRRRAGRAGGDQRRVQPAAADAAGAADLLQVEPRRHAGPHARGQLRHAAAVAGRRLRRLGAGAEDRAGLGRRPGDAQRRAEAGGARAGRSAGARRHRAVARGRAPGARRGERQPAQGQPRRRRARTARSPPTISSTRRPASSRSSSPTRTARRSAWRTSPTSSTASRTRSSPAGPAPSARSSSTCSASRAPTSSRSPTTSRSSCRSSRRRCRRAIDVSILSDRTETVRASVKDVQFTLVLTVFLVVLVIYVFLRSLRATIIPGVAVPLSLIATFGVMHLAGFSLNNLSLMALTISTGFVVDDAIVMVENIARYVEEGEKPFDAALKGAKQIGFTIVSLTVSLVAVLIPLLFMGGLIGRLFREFAVTLADRHRRLGAAVADADGDDVGLAAQAARRGAPGPLRARVRARLHRDDAVLRAHARRGCCATGAPRSSPRIAHRGAHRDPRARSCPKGFFPHRGHRAHHRRVRGGARRLVRAHDGAAAGARRRASCTIPTWRRWRRSSAPTAPTSTTNSGRFSITLKPRDDREADAAEIIARLQPQARARSTASRSTCSRCRICRSTIALSPHAVPVHARGRRLRRARRVGAEDPRQAARRCPSCADVASDQADRRAVSWRSPSIATRPARLGVTPQAIDDTLYDAFGQRIVSTIFTQLNLYRVILEVRPEDQQSTRRARAASSCARRRGDAGAAVDVRALRDQRTRRCRSSHQGQFPSVTLSFNTAHSASRSATAVDGHRPGARASSIRRPAIHGEFQGAARGVPRVAGVASRSCILAALITVYIVLGVLYESYIHPITILSTLPSAGVGALLALIVCRHAVRRHRAHRRHPARSASSRRTRS